MIITNGKLVTQIHFKNILNALPEIEQLQNSSNQLAAIYKGRDLIWLTTYQISVKSCYGSGVWLDNYNWIEDTWKN